MDTAALADLNRVGVNLNQMARRVNATGAVPPELRAALAEVRAVVEKLAGGEGVNFELTKPGRSFAGAMAYYLHDKREEETKEHPAHVGAGGVDGDAEPRDGRPAHGDADHDRDGGAGGGAEAAGGGERAGAEGDAAGPCVLAGVASGARRRGWTGRRWRGRGTRP